MTEEVWGVDLAKTQLLLAGGTTLAKTGIAEARPRGHAIQLRINMETMTEDGSARPGGGTLTVFEPPSGPGVRVDTYGYAGYRTNPNFDSLLAKLMRAQPVARLPSMRWPAASGRWRRSGWKGRPATSPSCARCWRTPMSAPDKVHTRFSSTSRPGP